MPGLPRFILALVLCGSALGQLHAQSEYGFVNTRPSGQPYLTPEESLRRFHVPPGYEVKVFAAEPDIINPISFTIDERGRLWVVECYEYPKRAPKDRAPRDRIKILEDTTGAGHADRVTVWAEGKDLPHFDLASGIEVGRGGVFLGAAPYLLFLRDAHGTGHCDQCDVLLRGFGSQDTHETLNTLQWGPDGRLYGLEGIFTQSRVGDIRLDAAVWRYDTEARKFDIFAEGTSNPWGLDFDPHGQAFATACVIPHAFHIVPGGRYIRQAGSSQNPYAYGLLREISDHLHHSESGWAHAGALVLEGDHVPPEFRGSLLMGSIHGTSIKRDVLSRRGSTFIARHAPDFLVSGDKNFRPINLRWSPDGSIYVIDWHDQNPCHQAAPDSWDMTHGRIYKIQRKATTSTPPGDLGQRSSRELVTLLHNDNPWWYRTALRLLAERRDQSVLPQLRELLRHSGKETVALRALWALKAVGGFDEALAEQALAHGDPWVRSWVIRLLGEGGRVSEAMLQHFIDLAGQDPAPEVRLQLASTAARLAGQDTLPLLHQLMQHADDVRDPCLPLMIWYAYEPRLANRPDAALPWLRAHAAGNALVTDEIVPRALRRLVAGERPEDLAACVAFLESVTDSGVRRKALEGMLQALENRPAKPPTVWRSAFAALARDADPEVQRRARRLAVRFHDVQALRGALAAAIDTKRRGQERIDAVHDLAEARPPEALRPLEQLLAHDANLELRCEACRALAGYEDPEIARAVVAGWAAYPPAVRAEAVNLLAGRRAWARELLAAVERKEVPRTDLNNNTILRMRALRDAELNARIQAAWGRVREQTPAEINQLIERMRAVLGSGRGSSAHGRLVFENQCAKCHRFEGRGHEVGPNLDGAARDIEYLLVNILDPNRVVGQPYYTRFVTLKDGRIETGLVAAEDARSITLKGENDALKVFEKKNVEEIIVQDKSLMPEGLQSNMSPADFRDLISYLEASPFLTEVAVVGPLPTSTSVKVDPENPLGTAGVTWARPTIGLTGRISLPAPTGEHEAVAYVAAEVTATEALRTRLLLGSGSPLEAWLNGRLVYRGRPADWPAAPDETGVEVALDKGVNRLLFRVTYSGSKEALFARLVDPQRRLTEREPTKPSAAR
jgi:putative membrane-bound dehydrogenase-like protein